MSRCARACRHCVKRGITVSEELPREKAKRCGLSALRDEELLAILLGSAGRGGNVFALAEEILEVSGGLSGLLKLSYEELTAVKGIKEAKALSILTVFEICRRLLEPRRIEKEKLNEPGRAADWLRLQLGGEAQEQFLIIFLNYRYEVIRYEVLFKGSDTASLVAVRQILRKALLYRAVYLLAAHNHPSGHCSPSEADVDLTLRLKEGALYLDMELLDHIIVAPAAYFSFRQEKLL